MVNNKGGQPEVGDLDQIKQQRILERLEIERQRKVEVWPGTCPTCLVGPGEPCMTIRGKRAIRHTARQVR